MGEKCITDVAKQLKHNFPPACMANISPVYLGQSHAHGCTPAKIVYGLNITWVFSGSLLVKICPHCLTHVLKKKTCLRTRPPDRRTYAAIQVCCYAPAHRRPHNIKPKSQCDGANNVLQPAPVSKTLRIHRVYTVAVIRFKGRFQASSLITSMPIYKWC